MEAPTNIENPFLLSLYGELSHQLELIKSEERNILRIAARSIIAIKPLIDQIRKYITENPFQDNISEISFFKDIKPVFLNKLIYYLKVYQIESGKPIGSIDAKLTYFQKELEKIDQSFTNHYEFYHYYQSGESFQDELYFIRGRKGMYFNMDVDWIYADPDFSTGYDFLIAKRMANEALSLYLQAQIKTLESPSQPTEEDTKIIDESSKANRYAIFIQTVFKGAEIYIFLKSLIDSGTIVNHNYKSLFEFLVPGISNTQQKTFTPSSLLKYSDKVDMEARENVKRMLQKMIRNVDSY